jgi:Fur family ferric uptake transcriptional regulator
MNPTLVPVQSFAHRWHAFLTERGLKSSSARDVIVEAFLRTRGHVRMDEILRFARAMAPHVGLSTVYRTMKLLEESGLAQRHHFEGESVRFEATLGKSHHDHLICRACGAILEFENAEIERLQEAVASDLAFVIEGHRHEIYGVCAACQRATQRRAG